MASININNLPAKAAAAITTADQVMTFTASGDTTQTPFNEAVAQANSLNLINSVKTVKITIPTAQVLTLYTTPVAFGLTVPVGYYLRVLGCDGYLDFNTIAYATNGKLLIKTVGTTDPQAGWSGAQFLFGTTNRYSTGSLTSGTSVTSNQLISGADLEAYIDIGNPTAGNSDIDIYLTYTLIEL
jgi:hypothetical protein